VVRYLDCYLLTTLERWTSRPEGVRYIIQDETRDEQTRYPRGHRVDAASSIKCMVRVGVTSTTALSISSVHNGPVNQSIGLLSWSKASEALAEDTPCQSGSQLIDREGAKSSIDTCKQQVAAGFSTQLGTCPPS
jgi:hypothetical protein